MRYVRVALLRFLVAAYSCAASASPAADQWASWSAETTNLLKAGDYPYALRLADRTIDEMITMLGAGKEATEVFAVVKSGGVMRRPETRKRIALRRSTVRARSVHQ
jgi:hypothetical protein